MQTGKEKNYKAQVFDYFIFLKKHSSDGTAPIKFPQLHQ